MKCITNTYAVVNKTKKSIGDTYTVSRKKFSVKLELLFDVSQVTMELWNYGIFDFSSTTTEYKLFNP
jgi:hypothetical protein